jgi:axial budding pattern protein 2
LVTISANSSDGTSATDGFSLLTVDKPSPLINEAFSQQLSRAFTLGPGYDSALYINELDESIRVPPGWSFSVGFEPSTFTNPDESPIYYTATEAGTAGLPSWLTFDNKTVTFDGVAPQEAEGSRHEIIVFGSDRFGYGDVQQKLIVVVGSHDFRLVEPFPVINATLRSEVNYTVSLGNVRLDDATITPSNVTIIVDLSHAPFLTYDSNTRLISGYLPTSLPNDTDIVIPVQLHSSYGDNLTDTVLLRVIPDIFVSDSLPALVVKPGGVFELDLKEYSAYDDAVFSAVITPPQSTSWLSFDAGSMKLHGTAPKNTSDYGDTTVEFSAFDRNTGITGSATLHVQYAPPGGSGAVSHDVLIALAIVGSILGLALLIGLAACCRHCIRSKREEASGTERDPVGLEGGESSLVSQEEGGAAMTEDSLRGETVTLPSSIFQRSSWGSLTHSSFYSTDIESNFGSLRSSNSKASTIFVQRPEFRAIWAARNKLATKDSSSTVDSLEGAEVVVATRGRRLTAVLEEQWV